ncbi:MAG: hemerythrin domain-containing protein [archaeon]|jgi:hemerythrin-like domain-containing protein
MEEKQSILKFMIIEHGILYNLLVGFRFQSSSAQNPQAALRNFSKFKEKLTPHHFAEESIIFKMDNKITTVPIIKVLKKEHTLIEKIVEKIDQNIANNEDAEENAANLQRLLRNHLNLEEKRFYPLLDKQLNDKEKEELIQKVLSITQPKKGILQKLGSLFG